MDVYVVLESLKKQERGFEKGFRFEDNFPNLLKQIDKVKGKKYNLTTHLVDIVSSFPLPFTRSLTFI